MRCGCCCWCCRAYRVYQSIMDDGPWCEWMACESSIILGSLERSSSSSSSDDEFTLTSSSSSSSSQLSSSSTSTEDDSSASLDRPLDSLTLDDDDGLVMTSSLVSSSREMLKLRPLLLPLLLGEVEVVAILPPVIIGPSRVISLFFPPNKKPTPNTGAEEWATNLSTATHWQVTNRTIGQLAGRLNAAISTPRRFGGWTSRGGGAIRPTPDGWLVGRGHAHCTFSLAGAGFLFSPFLKKDFRWLISVSRARCGPSLSLSLSTL